jgi:hypothetical protein
MSVGRWQRKAGTPVEAVEWLVGGCIYRSKVDLDFKKFKLQTFDKSSYQHSGGGEGLVKEEDWRRGGAVMMRLKFWAG